MSALVLDAGALVAVERGDAAMMARLAVARRQGLELRTNAMALAQVWRDRTGRQAGLASFLRAVDVRPVSARDGRAAGELLAAAGTRDPIDATVALLAEPGDRIITTDPADLTRLATAAARGALIVAC